MAGHASYDTLLATTLKNYKDKLTDNIFKSYPLGAALMKKGNIDLQDGGERIVVPMEYAENQTAKWYKGYDILDTTPQEIATAGEAEWRELAATVAISRREERQNSGRHQLINLVKAKVRNAEKTLKKKLDVAACGAGDDSTDAPYGLQTLVSTSPSTGVVMGIDRATAGNEWWRNYAVGSVGSFASNGVTAMSTAFNTCSDEGTDTTDLIITTPTIFGYYEKEAVEQLHINSAKKGDLGFISLDYKGVPVLFSSNILAGAMYFLNTDYLKMVVDKQSNMVSTPFIEPENQTAKVAKILFMGNLVMSNAKRQGVLAGITS